jgi:high-affinity nickel-transport protein
MSSISIAIVGFLLGVRHAVDPDHVVAVSTIATRTPSFRRAAGVGALWGLGHTLTIIAVGGALVLFRFSIAPRVGLALELGVAIMLILLGFQNLANARKENAPEPSSSRPLLVGMVHGMAGSAAVVLLVLAAVSSKWMSFAYLALFGLGTVVGMILVTGLIALPASLAMARVRHARRWLTFVSGVASIVLGLLLASELTDREHGLLSPNPSWTPR